MLETRSRKAAKGKNKPDSSIRHYLIQTEGLGTEMPEQLSRGSGVPGREMRDLLSQRSSRPDATDSAPLKSAERLSTGEVKGIHNGSTLGGTCLNTQAGKLPSNTVMGNPQAAKDQRRSGAKTGNKHGGKVGFSTSSHKWNLKGVPLPREVGMGISLGIMMTRL